MKFRLKRTQILATLALLLLSACQATEPSNTGAAQPAPSSVPAESQAAAPSPSAAAAAPSAASAAEPSTDDVVPPSAEWTTYRLPSGFEVEHPTNYTPTEGVNDQGEATVTFSPPGRGAAITITEQTSANAQATAGEYTGCQDLTINELSARRCINPTNLAFVVFVETGDAVYNVSAPGRGLRLDVFERLTASFKLGS